VVKFTHTSKKGRGKNMKRFLIGLAMLGVGCSIDSGTTEGKEKSSKENTFASFLPENDFHRTKRYYAAGEVTEDDFDLVIAAGIEIYQPILEGLGLNLTIDGDYTDETVNAYCSRDGDNVMVKMFGGLAKQPLMTVEGFAMVLCHELGHAVAGIPVYKDNPWAAIEGQSDYFATAACARKIFDPSSPMTYRVMQLMKKKKPTQPANCLVYRGADKTICELSLLGGLSLGAVLADLNDEPTPKYETPSKVVVKKTMEAHPPAQCRTDTYLAGALCNKNWDDNTIPSNKSEADKVSCAKPKCWYKS
jgi:hypothetical protein